MNRSTMRSAAAALVVTLAWSLGARAAGAPDDTAVRAAYCMKLTEASIALMNAAPKAVTPMLEQLRGQVKKKQEEKLEQLKGYFSTRASALESDAAREALKTVDGDAQVDNSGRRTVLAACATTCKTTNPPPTQEGRTCIDACAKEDPVVKRLDRCTTLEWLPADGKPQAGAAAKPEAAAKGDVGALPK
jgi:hypothetical protein